MIKLKRITVSTTRGSKGEYIRLSSNGQIAISAATVTKLGITKDDKAVFFQDEDNPKDWYFGFGKEGDYEIRNNKGKPGDATLQFSSAALKERVLHALDLPNKTIRLYLSKEPLELEGAKLWKLNYRK